jgi:uncharacterized membrane protein
MLVYSLAVIGCPDRIFVIKMVSAFVHYELMFCSPRYLRAVTAAMSIANIVKSSLGPLGLDKMMVDNIGVRLCPVFTRTVSLQLMIFPRK